VDEEVIGDGCRAGGHTAVGELSRAREHVVYQDPEHEEGTRRGDKEIEEKNGSFIEG